MKRFPALTSIGAWLLISLASPLLPVQAQTSAYQVVDRYRSDHRFCAGSGGSWTGDPNQF
jgi:hypothetical protein